LRFKLETAELVGRTHAGQRECLWQEALTLECVASLARPARRVYRFTERSIDKHGNALLLPEYTLEGWATTLPE